MKRLIVCCDGTWNTPGQEDNGRPAPTNVVKLFASVAKVDDAGIEQWSYYRPGVGTSGGLVGRALGGGIGRGLGDDIKSAYKWLADWYQGGAEPDEIFLFGFSRGAYAARSLAGMIGRCGLLQHPEGLDETQKWHRVDAAYRAYRRISDPDRDWVTTYPRLTGAKIHFLGVWDTVGALGIPDELFWKVLENPRKHQFHNTKIGDHVVHARHAVAMDEQRRTFSPTLWTGDCGTCDIKEEWFVGVHGDVGGSYAERGLGDITLDWMMTEAEQKGLKFDTDMRRQLDPDPAGVLHDSVKGIFKHFRTRPRAVPFVGSSASTQSAQVGTLKTAHATVRARQLNPPITQANYRPSRRPVSGQPIERPVYARERWNATGLYLSAGETYTFTAEGSWLDGSIPCDPDGPVPGVHFGQAVQLLGRPFDWLQGARRMSQESAVASGARREQSLPFFCLIGVIANGDGVDTASKVLQRHETFRIGSRTRHAVTRSGYLYCYANDVWRFYFNNKGGVRLTVTQD